MRMTTDELSTKVVVRRARSGAAPFVWEISKETIAETLYVSPDGFTSMEAAYHAGRARLAEFVSSARSTLARQGPPWQSGQTSPRDARSADFEA